jgi:hypothetical protein
MLAEGPAVPNCRVISFSYDANIANFLSPASQNSIFEHSKNLLNHLDMVRDGEAVSLRFSYILFKP